MKVIKRNGKSEDVKFDKISSRIKKLTYGLNPRFIDADLVSKKVIDGLYDGVSSRELDNLAAETAAGMTSIHPDYSMLASRLAITAHYKETEKSFSKTIKNLYNYIHPNTGKKAGLVNEATYQVVMDNAALLDSAIVQDRDFLIDYFGFRTLHNAYLLKDANGNRMERVQHLWMRVAVGIWGDNIEEVLKTYALLSNKLLIHATPTLFNAGTKKNQLSSCYLIENKGDSIKEIYETLGDVALISQAAGGIGLHLHDVRGKGSFIRGSGGVSNGLMPLFKVLNETARYVNQSGKRNGSFAIYLEPWHSDIFEFLEIRKNHGKEEMRARDLFTALWNPDLFFKRVEEGGKWSLMCPDECPGLSDAYGDEFVALYERYEAEGKAKRTIDAQELWDAIQVSQIETGTPYMLAKDAANRKSNQKNLGTIKSSNLCVAPETQILTSSGYQTISDLENETVEAWNGHEYSEVKIHKTSDSSSLLTVKLSNGQTVDATPYHKWYVQRGYERGTGVNKPQVIEKRTNELTAGDKLIKLKTPIVDFKGKFPDAYTQGFFSGDGCAHKGKNHIDLYGGKLSLVPHLKGSLVGTYREKEDKQRFQINPYYQKFEVPFYYSIKSRLEWFAGLADSDGCALTNMGTESLQITSVELSFLQDVQLMLQTLGVNSKVLHAKDAGWTTLPNGKGGSQKYPTQKLVRLGLGADALYQLSLLGFQTNRLKFSFARPNRNSEHFVKIISVEDKGRIDATYCATEPKRNKLVFNGVLTGNCAEIIQFSSSNEIAVCNLASIPVNMYYNPVTRVYDYQGLYDTVYQVTKNLNRVIDVNYYPVPETKTSNMRHRPMGIGVQGLADLFALAKVAFDSQEAFELNAQIFETMYYAHLRSSCDLAKVEGSYETFMGSPLSEGKFQFDLWEDVQVKPVKGTLTITSKSPVQLSGLWNWEILRKEILEHGVRNSLGLTLMPTASTSQILGNNEAAEPYTENIYVRKVLSGEFLVVNKHLVNDLDEIGLWNQDMRTLIMANKGSVQNIEVIPADIRARFKTVWEIKQRPLLDMAASRGAFICQSQSMNLFIPKNDKLKETLTTAIMYGWKKGLKTLSYYLRSNSVLSANASLGMDANTLAEIKGRLTQQQQVGDVIQAKESTPTFTEAEIQACRIGFENGESSECLACGS